MNRFDELAASWKPHPDFALDAGKTILKWGKGYTGNPVAFVECPKDSSDLRLPREGYVVLSATVSREFSGALGSVNFNPLLPLVSENVNSDFGKAGYVNAAGKLLLDFGATDVGFYRLNSGSRTDRFGADFLRCFGSDVEVYGKGGANQIARLPDRHCHRRKHHENGSGNQLFGWRENS